MKIKKHRQFLLPVIGCCIVAVLILLFGDFEFGSKRETESYSSFYEEVRQGLIESVKITEDSVLYTKKNSDKKYKTENPESPLLKEYLLQNDVSVTVEKDSLAVIDTIFNFVFYGFFVLIFVTVFRKFISPNTFKVVRKTGKNFDDIVGMDSLKRDTMQIMDIMTHPDIYRKKGIRMPKGIILEGEPGNGKTLFAKALAGESKVNFIPAKATDFESMFMAIGPMKVKLLFKKARRKAPCIIFIDEFDGIGTKRNYSGSAIETENTRIVTALLNELDGFEANDGILVIAATNSINALDSALIRPGRFDARFSVPYPDGESVRKLVRMYTNNRELESDCSVDKIAERFRGFSCAKIESVLNRSALVAGQNGRQSISMQDVDIACKELETAR